MKYVIYVKGSAAFMSVMSLLLLLFSLIKLNRFSNGEVVGSIETDLPGVSIEDPGFFTTYADAQLLASVSFLLFIISTLLLIVFWNKTTTHFPKFRDHKTASASPADKSSNNDEGGDDNDDNNDPGR
ncbi:MAG: hypothetical protein JJU32_06420 [Phormidium sp. BM_Day4_Bin.17]|nr:hypothetical protein [Phormidium sp. BM_Day4_Bin.17]UCJ12552.1 MAG: hypothetical protein JWS08_01630 [Phormidium sp. PBR-2020]